MIKVGVDGRLLQGNLTGVGKYVLHLLTYLTNTDPSISIVIFSNRKIAIAEGGFPVVYDVPVLAKVKPMVWSKFLSHRIINKNKIDIFFSGDAFLPLFLSVKKIVSVVHDVNHILAPETMSSLHLLTTRLFYKKDVLKASHIIANSYATARKIKQYFNKQTSLVIYPIIDSSYRPIATVSVNTHLADLKITFPYILTVATQEPRKNLAKTINAFISLKRDGKIPQHKLLLVGSKGWKSIKLSKMIAANQDIISLGYTNDDVMPYLYNGADVFVFPSKYEGFGMPPREAILCGTPAIVTDIPELREATCGLAKYIDPENEAEFKQAILEEIEAKQQVVFTENASCKNQLQQLIPLLHQLAAS